MKTTVKLLREFIILALEGDDRIKRGGTPGDWRANRDDAFEAEVEVLVGEPEFRTIDAFVNHKLDNDEYSFNAAELQALARNAESKRLGHQADVASPTVTASVKQSLVSDFGFRFEPRQPTRFARGSMSSAHGSHPFAGSGGGGSGFGSDFAGPTFLSFGGGPGAMGSGKPWDASDVKSLSMGSSRRRK